MALTRKMLKDLGLADEVIDQVIDAHQETVSGLKAERDRLKTDADKLPEIQRKLETAEQAAKDGGKDAYKVKYDALKEDFDKYKGEITAKETRAAKETAYRNLLKETGVAEKRIDAVLKVTSLDGIEVVDGKIKDASKLQENIKTEWADFITATTTKGAQTTTPPGNTGGDDKSAEVIARVRSAMGLAPTKENTTQETKG